MDIYKDFAQKLRKATLNDVYIILNEDITPQLKKYVRLLTELPFEEGSYNAYYGAVKRIVTSFINYYATAIDKVVLDADKYGNIVDRFEILSFMDRTINIHAERQVDFGKDYLPVRSAEERTIYDEIQNMYDAFVQKMYEFRANLEKIDKQDKAEAFAQEHYKITVQKTSDLFDFAHIYIAMFLADRIKQIGTSLEEIYLRLRNNLRQIEEESEKAMTVLMNDLYDQNRQLMMLCRQYRNNSVELAEVNRTIAKTRAEMEVFKYDTTEARLEEEVEFWSRRIHDFKEVANLLTRLRNDKDYVDKQREIYATRTCTELPGSKGDCWTRIGANFEEKSEQLRNKIIEAGKCLVTFFGIRGVDRIFYKSDLGKYYLDEFNHQVYVEDYGLKMSHLNCKGDFLQVSDTKPYYFDEYGRYIKNEKGEKIHQLAACTSEYKLDDDQLLRKITKDCGHSVTTVKQCKMRIKDPNDVEVFPDIEQVDLHKKLDAEVIKYLWDSFGHILPYALNDVCHEHSKNPIHNLAHKLLHHNIPSKPQGPLLDKGLLQGFPIRPEPGVGSGLHPASSCDLSQVMRPLTNRIPFCPTRHRFYADYAETDYVHLKYEKTYAETKQRKKEAEKFRLKVYKDRQAKAAAASAAWKAKQVKRRKPEELDDTENQMVYDAQMSMAEFINSLAYFYD